MYMYVCDELYVAVCVTGLYVHTSLCFSLSFLLTLHNLIFTSSCFLVSSPLLTIVSPPTSSNMDSSHFTSAQIDNIVSLVIIMTFVYIKPYTLFYTEQKLLCQHGCMYVLCSCTDFQSNLSQCALYCVVIHLHLQVV